MDWKWNMSGILLHLQRSQKENLCVQRSSRSIFIDRVAQVDLIGIRGPLQIQTSYFLFLDFLQTSRAASGRTLPIAVVWAQ